jgi:molecular chaperone DnaJ
MASGPKDFYQVLGVPEKATSDEIKKAYRKLAKTHHPDANRGDAKAAERFKEIGEAYSVLSDPEKRKKYDEMKRLGGLGGFAGFGGGRPRAGAQPGAGAGQNVPFEDLGGGFGSISDLFSSLFDLGRRQGGQQQPAGKQRGGDVEYVVEIPFVTAVTGGKISINVAVTEECATCGGNGAKPGTSLKTCGECGGSGTVSFGQGGFAVKRPCPACLGRGKIPEAPCEVCHGKGSVRQQRKLDITVPSGVDTGSRMRLSGQGERGSQGGPPGDLVLSFKVQPHRFFKREGLDIHVTVPINIVQATLGSKIRVKTVADKKVVLKIPKGTQSGTKFRIRGQGVQKEGGVGDQFVEVVVQVPEELSEAEQKAMEEFADASGLKH